MSNSMSRRNFLAVSAAATAAALAACNNGGQQGGGEPAPEPEPEAAGVGVDSGFGYMVVEQDGGARLSYSPESGLNLIEVDGKYFKDFEGTGELVPYADWRLSACASPRISAPSRARSSPTTRRHSSTTTSAPS